MQGGSRSTSAAGREGEFFGHSHVTLIEPRRGWARLDLRELWAYRELLWVLILRDVRVRYQQTILGGAWALLRPLLAVGIFSVVFGKVAKMPSEGVPYPLFALAGVLPWTFFSSAVAGGAESLVGSQHLVSKVYFPRLIIPLASIGVALVDFAVGLLVLVGVAAYYGAALSTSLLMLPILLVLLVFSTVGVTTVLSAANVAYRDVRHIVPFLLQVWLYATPVVYPASMFPGRYRQWLYLNPAAGPVEAFRAVILGRPVDSSGLALSLSVSAVLLVGGLAYFSRVERRFADII
jgi:lipopolysaccharide transport system permease protein